MTIGIDIDDTITKTSEKAAENLAKYDNNYLDYHNLPSEKYEEFMKLYQAEILRTVELREGVKEAFRYFKDKGYRIVIITARDNTYSKEIKTITLDYLAQNELDYDKIILGKENKGKIAKEEGIDIFIDDKETVLDDMVENGIKTIRRTEKTDSKHVSFANWSDIVNYIKTLEG